MGDFTSRIEGLELCFDFENRVVAVFRLKFRGREESFSRAESRNVPGFGGESQNICRESRNIFRLKKKVWSRKSKNMSSSVETWSSMVETYVDHSWNIPNFG